MRRTVYNQLLQWKNKPDGKRKPLILEGARQTGKTWLAEELGKNEFMSFVEINFENNEQLRNVFEQDFDINRILMAIQASTGIVVRPGETLIFLDEIQYARRGLLSLKYFYQNAPEYHVIAAGSLLGVIDHKDDSFPVGKVEFLKVFPLTFFEFLSGIGQEGMVDIIRSKDWKLVSAFHDKLVDLLRQYYYVGGMPEAVATYAEQKDYNAVREIQYALLSSYSKDFSKHPPKEIAKRMELLWNSIPSQLAKENKKFIFSAMRESARARDYETTIQWLCDAGIIYKVTRVSAGELPLKGFEDADAFKLYVLDIGLHGAMSGLDSETLISGNDFFEQYKGALTEQFVLQTLQALQKLEIHYWTPDVGIAEVDFVIQNLSKIIPIEVKAVRNLRAKSLKHFSARYQTPMVLRTSLSQYCQGEDILDLPLYALEMLKEL